MIDNPYKDIPQAVELIEKMEEFTPVAFQICQQAVISGDRSLDDLIQGMKRGCGIVGTAEPYISARFQLDRPEFRTFLMTKFGMM